MNERLEQAARELFKALFGNEFTDEEIEASEEFKTIRAHMRAEAATAFLVKAGSQFARDTLISAIQSGVDVCGSKTRETFNRITRLGFDRLSIDDLIALYDLVRRTQIKLEILEK